MEFPDERDYDTLGGFILHQLQEIPKQGDLIEFEGNTFCVQNMKDNRVGIINVIKNEK